MLDGVAGPRRAAAAGAAGWDARRLVWRPMLRTDPGAAGLVRHWARQALPVLFSRPLRPGLGDEVELVLSELVTNAVVHAGGVDEVALDAAETLLQVVVSDRSLGVPVVRKQVGVGVEHGRGMYLVETLALRWGTDRDGHGTGKSVWLHLPVDSTAAGIT